MAKTGRPEAEWFDGHPCRSCGGTRRYVSGRRRCVFCNRRYVKQWAKTSDARDERRGTGCDICARVMEAPCYDEVDGVFRGWLCPNCNTGLAYFDDNPGSCLAAARYLADWLR